MKSDLVYLQQIIESVHKIKKFIKGFDQDKFVVDQKTQSAVIMQLALIGELAKRVSKENQSQISLPWKDISGFRDRAIHINYNSFYDRKKPR
ncbi:MAG TPA: HepT-like ribonuclease domain-containing protein [Methylomirabilota bacterium]|nr:HepT-like ribonuclease domain-containing protein [Methylomirabilota bacterium]